MLDIFTVISGKVRIFRIGPVVVNGSLVPYQPPVDTPADGQTQEELYGLSAALNVLDMNQPEQERYQNLMNLEKPKASSVEELRTLTLSLEQLGSDVNGRMAAAQNKTAEVAGPFSTATLDATQGSWLTYPEGKCLTVLPPAPKK